MREIKDIQIELLKELDEVCNKNNIKYFIHGETARYALINKTIKGGPHNVIVAMTLKDAEQFIRCIKQQGFKHRYVESLLTNPRYSYFYVTYGNSNTTELNVAISNKNVNYGINIKIYYIDDISARKSNKKRKKFNKIWRTWNSSTAIDSYPRDNWKYKYDNPFARMFPWKKWARERYLDIHGKHAVNGFADIPNHKAVVIEGKKFEGCIFAAGLKRFEVDGLMLPFVADIDGYFGSYVKGDWREQEFVITAPNPKVIYDTNKGFEENIQVLAQSGVLKQARNANFEVTQERGNHAMESKRVIENVSRLVDMTKDEMEVSQGLLLHREKLLQLNFENVDDFEFAKEHLEPVVKMLKAYKGYGLTFTIEPDIDQIIDSYMVFTERQKLLSQILELRKKKYLVP